MDMATRIPLKKQVNRLREELREDAGDGYFAPLEDEDSNLPIDLAKNGGKR